MNTLTQYDGFLRRCQNASIVQAREQLEPILQDYTVEGDTSEADYRDIDTGAKFGMLGYTNPSGQNHRDEYTPGTEWVVQYNKFTGSIILPEELIIYMQGNTRIKKQQLKLFASIGPDFVDASEWTKETIAADLVLRATTTTPTRTHPGVFRDGLAFASASHVTLRGGITWSNLQTASAMTQMAIAEGITMLGKIPTEEGRPQGALGEITLMYGRFNEFQVRALLGTDKQPGTMNNDINVLTKGIEGNKPVKIKPLLNPYLGDTFSGWALIDTSKKNNKLVRLEKQEAKITYDVDINNGNRVNRCMMLFATTAISSKCMVINMGI